MFKFRKCKNDEILTVKNFLQKYNGKQDGSTSWMIDRLEFTYAMSCLSGTTQEEYINDIGIWEDNGEIIGIVNTEGEKHGEAFIQLSTLEPDNNLIDEMLDYIINNLMINRDDKKVVFLRLGQNYPKIVNMAVNRGFKKQNWSEISTKMDIKSPFNVSLPAGFSFVPTKELTLKNRVSCYLKAFNNDISLEEKALLGYKRLTNMEDYNPDYDLNVVNEKGEVVCFATLWYDSVNNWGILEPVGTHPDYRRMGLGKNLIYKLSNFLYENNCKAIYVGSDQVFYKSIGFEIDCIEDVYLYETN